MKKVEIIYKIDDFYYKEGDIVEVEVQKPYENSPMIRKGKMLKPLLISEIRLDVSVLYNSEIIDIDVSDIVKIKLI